MMAFQVALALNDLLPNTMQQVMIAGKPVLLVRDGDQVYATGGRCRHVGGPLAEGTLAGHVVTCPWHGSRWDVTDGHALQGPYNIPGLSAFWARILPKLPRYAVQIVAGMVQVDLDKRPV